MVAVPFLNKLAEVENEEIEKTVSGQSSPSYHFFKFPAKFIAVVRAIGFANIFFLPNS